MISNKKAKFIKSLQLKKYRKQEQSFLVEGKVSVLELLNSNLSIQALYTTDEFYQSHIHEQADSEVVEIVDERDLIKVGTLKSNNAALAIVSMPEDKQSIDISQPVLVLDDINDPGNLGTIIRIADWYGFHQLICSPETTDQYNPKCISATKGSFTRVSIFEQHLPEFLSDYKHPIFGALLEGEDVHKAGFQKACAILIGNESHGIQPDLLPFITDPITIPRFGGAESLNAAIATAIICDVYRQKV
ncbi:MAG: RNA methyltransferase [Cyclobacteriaceae bacterium]